jgi:hypothetical protein
MSSRTLSRLSGLALMISLLLPTLDFVFHPPSEQVVDVLKPAYGLAWPVSAAKDRSLCS